MEPGQQYRFLFFLFVALGLFSGEHGNAQDLRYSGSMQFTSGSYFFTERTESFYFSNGLEISGAGSGLSFTVPLIIQNTPWVSYNASGIGPLPTGGPKSGVVGSNRGKGHAGQKGKGSVDPGTTDTLDVSQANFGDPSISGYLRLYESIFGRTVINASAGIKLPLADPSTGFGTGAWDYGAGLSVSQRLGDAYMVFLSGMAWRLGDMEGLPIKNIISYGASIGRGMYSSKWFLSLSYFGTTRVIENVTPPQNVGLNIGYRILPEVTLNGTMFAGLTESASDISLSIGWTIGL